MADATWVDVLDPSDSERVLVSGLLESAIPDAEDVDEIEDSARCFIDQAGIHVHSLFLANKEGLTEVVSVASILQPDRLITIREQELADFRLFRMRAKRAPIETPTPPGLLVALLEQKVENLADALEGIHEELEDISNAVLRKGEFKPEEIVSNLAACENRNGKIRLCLMDTQRVISFLQRHVRVAQALHDDCREMARDIDTLLSHMTFLFDKINFLMDFTQGYINIQQNQIIKIFSIAAVVFLPPTLVASIYGMNFAVMPELKWLFGYPWALGLMIFSGFAPYWYFKRKGWL
ncbi:MAG: magnesium/cobalt transporter CorA [Salinisphaera sp.]|nr:magnesium/cobalt transporter CorA [Salinisphaera sp.]